jgi:hypothetical protein
LGKFKLPFVLRPATFVQEIGMLSSSCRGIFAGET